MPPVLGAQTKMGGEVAEDAGGRRGKRRGRKERRREKEESFQGLMLKHKQGCPTKDRPLSMKDGRLSVWNVDQMI